MTANYLAGKLLRGQQFALIANALRLTPTEFGVTRHWVGTAIAQYGEEWPQANAYLRHCVTLAEHTRSAYPSIEESPLGPTMKGPVAGRTEETVLAELDQAIRTEYNAAIAVLRTAAPGDFDRIRITWQVLKKSMGRDHGASRYLEICGQLASLVHTTRDDWS